MKRFDVLGVPIAATDYDRTVDRFAEWLADGHRTYVTVTGVHGVMESQRDPELLAIHRRAGLCVPDGMPMVWLGKAGGHAIERVYGPDLMVEVCRRSLETGWTHYFYGGKDGVPERLRDALCARFPGLRVVGTHSPPFRPLDATEEAALAAEIEALAPDFLWVGLSTPKQERWMAAHVGRLRAGVMLGVGAAFDLNAGLLRRSPRWMQRIGMEWFFRLCVEPRRLWRRYLGNNPRFILSIAGQWLGLRRRASGRRPVESG